MNKEKLTIWNREFDLEIRYDCYSGEQVLDSQKDAVSCFLKAKSKISDSLDKVKAYCLAQNGDEIKDDTIQNIFKYVAPKYLYVPRNKDKHMIAIMCNYKFDSENGLAIVFENEKFKEIGKQDIIL